MRILLAEDDTLLGDGLRAGLRQHGFSVDWVRDGAAAERELRAQPYAAAVLDLGLPLRDGLDVLAAVRRAGITLPVLVLTPLLGELLHLPRALLGPLMLSLALGTPLLSLLGAVVAALTVGIRRSGMLLAVLALPLFVPVLVFGAGAVVAASQGLPWVGALYLLAAGLALSLVLAPLAAAAALRIALN